MRKDKLWVPFFIAMILLPIIYCQRKKSFDENAAILENPKYSIGIVTEYDDAYDYYGSRRLSTMHSPSIKFYFYHNKKIIAVYQGTLKKIPFEGIHVGDKFLVAYLDKEPKKCLMLFDKPIKDSIDYYRYCNKLKYTKP